MVLSVSITSLGLFSVSKQYLNGQAAIDQRAPLVGFRWTAGVMVTVDFRFFHCAPLGGAIGSRLLVTWVDLCLAMSCHVLLNRQLGNTGLNVNMVLDLLAMTSWLWDWLWLAIGYDLLLCWLCQVLALQLWDWLWLAALVNDTSLSVLAFNYDRRLEAMTL